MVEANGWSDKTAIKMLPTCLTSWALEEFETVPRHYIEQRPGEQPPKLEDLLIFLKTKMQQYRSKRASKVGVQSCEAIGK